MDEPMQQLKDWIAKRHPEAGDIAPDLDLIENRLIDSLIFVEFVFVLEQVTGQDIDMDNLDVEDFRTLDNISKRYLPPR